MDNGRWEWNKWLEDDKDEVKMMIYLHYDTLHKISHSQEIRRFAMQCNDYDTVQQMIFGPKRADIQ